MSITPTRLSYFLSFSLGCGYDENFMVGGREIQLQDQPRVKEALGLSNNLDGDNIISCQYLNLSLSLSYRSRNLLTLKFQTTFTLFYVLVKEHNSKELLQEPKEVLFMVMEVRHMELG
ncbi:hypothetical protein M5689_000245 [Euphorbia peplus]|nr:hypothetical protein M5689_000245 [Euphorbia peplus]